MIAKGSPAVAGLAIPYFNDYYCTTCLPAWWGLKASNLTETSATVSWTTNGTQGTVLYLGTDPNSLAVYYSNPTLMTAHSVNITDRTAFTTYYYYVGAITDSYGRTFTPPGSQSDGAGGFKPATAKFTTPDLQPPSVPTNLHTTSIGLTFITIAWDASTDNIGIDSYEVWRKKSSDTTFALVGTTTGTTLNNTLLQSNTSYDFKVRAKDLAGNYSDFTPVLTATTLTPPPKACSDGLDNDGDGLIDYPADPGCSSPVDNDESGGGGGGGGECTEPTPSRLYLSNRAGGAYSIVPVDLDISATPHVYKNVGTPIPVTDTPGELAANPKGKTLYAIVGTDLAVIDVVSNSVVETIPIGGVSDTHQVVVSPDGKTVYVSYRYSPGLSFRIAVVDTSTNTVLDTITSTSNPDNSSFEGCYLPIGLGINPTGNPLYVACRDINSISKDRFLMIDTDTKAVVSPTFSTFNKDSNNLPINAIAVRPDGLKVYVARLDTSASTVEVFDGVSGDHAKSIALPLHAAPRAAVATLDNLGVYVADQALGTHLINADSDTRVKTLTQSTSRGFDIALSPDGLQLYPLFQNKFFAWDITTSSEALLATITGTFTQGYMVTIVPSAPGEPCVAGPPSRLYFSNTASSAYSVVPVDLDTSATPPVYKNVGTPIAVPKKPGELASIPDGPSKGRYLYAVVGSDLAVIDVVGNNVVNTYPGAGGVVDTHHLVISPDGKTLYLAYRATNTKPVKSFRVKAFDIDADPKAPTLKALIADPAFNNCLIPIGIGIHPSGNPVYVACRDATSTLPDRFLLIDTATNIATLGSTFARDSNQSFINSIAVRPDGTKVYVAKSATADKLEVFDGITGAHALSITLPGSSTPKAAVVTLDNLKVYVVDQGLGTHLIDSDADAYVKTLTRLSSFGFDIAMTPDGTQIYPLHLNKLFAWDITTSPETLLATVTGAFTAGYQVTITPGGSP